VVVGLPPPRGQRGQNAEPIRGRPGAPRGASLVIALGLVGLALLGCVACQAHAQTGVQQARGLVVNVQARSIAVTEAVTVRTDDGRELTFRVDPGVDVTPGHLREHMTLAQPVLVTYEQTPDGLLATRIDDA